MNQPNDVGAHGEFADDEAVRSLEFSLAFPHNCILDGVDVQHGRISAWKHVLHEMELCICRLQLCTGKE